MMTPDQIKELATLTANVAHIVDSLDKLQASVEAMPKLMAEFAKSKELDALKDQVVKLGARIETLERGSPTRLWELSVKGAAGVGIIWGLVAMLRDFFHLGTKP